MDYREAIVDALEQQYRAKIKGHLVNINIMLDNIVSVAEHPDVIGMVDAEIAKIAEWEERLAILIGYLAEPKDV
jgi:hypothetical protein